MALQSWWLEEEEPKECSLESQSWKRNYYYCFQLELLEEEGSTECSLQSHSRKRNYYYCSWWEWMAKTVVHQSYCCGCSCWLVSMAYQNSKRARIAAAAWQSNCRKEMEDCWVGSLLWFVLVCRPRTNSPEQLVHFPNFCSGRTSRSDSLCFRLDARACRRLQRGVPQSLENWELSWDVPLCSCRATMERTIRNIAVGS